MEQPELKTGEEIPAEEYEDTIEDEIEESKPEVKMSLGFYLALALIGFLVLFILVVNVPGMRASAGPEMTQGTWTLQSYANSSGVLLPTLSSPAITARFGNDGRFSGSAGCNRYSGVYTVKEYSLTVSNIAVTAMSCPQPGVMDQESVFLDDLGKIESFRIGTGILKFYDKSGKNLLVFVSP